MTIIVGNVSEFVKTFTSRENPMDRISVKQLLRL
jgi:hypothetical protein